MPEPGKTPFPEERVESWPYEYLKKRYDELMAAYLSPGEPSTTCKRDYQNILNDKFQLETENEALKEKIAELEMRIEELQGVITALNNPHGHGSDTGNEALESAFKANEELRREKRDQSDEVEQLQATIRDLGDVQERLHQLERRNDRDETDGGENSMNSLADQTDNPDLQPDERISTPDIPWERRLKRLEEELSRERAWHEDTRRELYSLSDTLCERELRYAQEELAREKAENEELRAILHAPVSKIPCETRLRELRADLDREEKAHELTKKGLEKCRSRGVELVQKIQKDGNDALLARKKLKKELEKLREGRSDDGCKKRCTELEQRLSDLQKELEEGRKDGGCKERCKMLEARICRFARVVRESDREMQTVFRDLTRDIDCDEGNGGCGDKGKHE